MVFNATFNNISVISWQSVLLVEETGVPGENLIQTCFRFCNRVRFGNSDKHFTIVVEFEIFGYKKSLKIAKGEPEDVN
jgi:hypothetical protein